MKSVFLLWHTHEIPDQEDDSKLIGVYESRDAALSAQERASRQPGFAQLPEGFLISEYEVGKDHWPEGFITVFPNRK